jgi:ribosomal protein S10
MNLKYKIKAYSFNKKSLSFYITNISEFFKYYNMTYIIGNLKIYKKKITLLRSPFVNKNSRNQLQLVVYGKYFEFNLSEAYYINIKFLENFFFHNAISNSIQIKIVRAKIEGSSSQKEAFN